MKRETKNKKKNGLRTARADSSHVIASPSRSGLFARPTCFMSSAASHMQSLERLSFALLHALLHAAVVRSLVRAAQATTCFSSHSMPQVPSRCMSAMLMHFSRHSAF